MKLKTFIRFYRTTSSEIVKPITVVHSILKRERNHTVYVILRTFRTFDHASMNVSDRSPFC